MTAWRQTAADLASHRLLAAALAGTGVVLGVAVAIFTSDIVIGVAAAVAFIVAFARHSQVVDPSYRPACGPPRSRVKTIQPGPHGRHSPGTCPFFPAILEDHPAAGLTK